MLGNVGILLLVILILQLQSLCVFLCYILCLFTSLFFVGVALWVGWSLVNHKCTQRNATNRQSHTSTKEESGRVFVSLGVTVSPKDIPETQRPLHSHRLALPFTHQSMGQEGGGEGREDATTRAPTVGRTKGAQRKDEEILCLPSLPSLLS